MYDGSSFKPLAADDADSVVALRHPTRDQVDALVRRAHAERAAAIAEMLAGAIAGAVHWVRRRREKVAAMRELMELDQRSLNDIGVTRDDIAELVYGARRAGPVLRGQMLVDFVENQLVHPFRAWRLRARTRRELMELDDAALSDIGIERGQIDAIAQAVAKTKADGRTVPVTAALVLGGFAPRPAANANAPARRLAVDAAD